MTERKEKPMSITDADIERAIHKNLAKLKVLPEARVPFDKNIEDGADDNNATD